MPRATPGKSASIAVTREGHNFAHGRPDGRIGASPSAAHWDQRACRRNEKDTDAAIGQTKLWRRRHFEDNRYGGANPMFILRIKMREGSSEGA
jgi:hypothetical protein